jgi:adenylate kinase
VIIVTFGGPGSGKGTHSTKIGEKYGIPHISTGDLLRDEMKINPRLKADVEALIKIGQLAPDDVVIPLLEKRLGKEDCAKGFVLDGFPRTVPQKEALDALLAKKGKKVDAAIHIDIAEDMMMQRLNSRWNCKDCKSTFSKLDDPDLSEKTPCKKCGGELFQRPDDTKEAILKRIEKYKKETLPEVPLYKNDRLYYKVSFTDIKASPEKNFELIAKVLETVEAKMANEAEGRTKQKV